VLDYCFKIEVAKSVRIKRTCFSFLSILKEKTLALTVLLMKISVGIYTNSSSMIIINKITDEKHLWKKERKNKGGWERGVVLLVITLILLIELPTKNNEGELLSVSPSKILTH
jgi:di/tricarboxylate transporter